MTSRGFLIRFIDIGLIVLFGFILISDIENLSQVELSRATEAQEVDDDAVERAFVTVAIAPDGSFALADPASGDLLAAGVERVDVLTELLRRIKADHEELEQELVVLISPHEDSIVQRTVDVMDVCDRLGVGKSLQADLGLGEGA
jgi:biopolymer transport protein ExbD